MFQAVQLVPYFAKRDSTLLVFMPGCGLPETMLGRPAPKLSPCQVSGTQQLIGSLHARGGTILLRASCVGLPFKPWLLRLCKPSQRGNRDLTILTRHQLWALRQRASPRDAPSSYQVFVLHSVARITAPFAVLLHAPVFIGCAGCFNLCGISSGATLRAGAGFPATLRLDVT